MSYVIRGGRQRANSEGDILEPEFSHQPSANKQSKEKEKTGNKDRISSSRNSTLGTGKETKANINKIKRHLVDEQNIISKHGITEIKDQTHHCLRADGKEYEISSENLKLQATGSVLQNEDHDVFESDSENSNSSSRKFFSFKSVRRKVAKLIKGSDSETNTKVNSLTMLTATTDPLTVPKWKSTPGTLGIFNHRNSCFMNAVLQCLSNTDSFTEYFITELYKAEIKNSKSNQSKKHINRNHGEVTEQLGKLFKSLWSGNYKSEISRDFKYIVGKANSQYSGDHQHDAQEFLLWLLDKLHEDVCIPSRKKHKQTKVCSI